MMSYFDTIGWTVGEQLELVIALNVGSVELTSFADFDFATVFLSVETDAKFEAAMQLPGLMFAIEYTNTLMLNENIDLTNDAVFS